jgi:hypothetical protein
MKLPIYAIVLCLLAACGATQIGGNRPGSTQAEFSNELLDCRAMSQRVFHYEDQSAIVQCMEGKNWTVSLR